METSDLTQTVILTVTNYSKELDLIYKWNNSWSDYTYLMVELYIYRTQC